MNEVAEIIEKAEIKNQISAYEFFLLQHPDVSIGDNPACPLKHSFANGIYVREIFIPKGAKITGKIHRHEHPNFLMKGEVSVATEGGGVERLKAPMSIISPAGTKRAVYAHEDTVWITCHRTDKTDLAEIEKEVILCNTYEELEAIESKNENKKISA